MGGLLHAPLSWFWQRLQGEVLNRASEDFAELDYVIHFTFRSMLMVILAALGTAAIIAASTPPALIGVVVAIPAYWYTQVRPSSALC